jgi:hypothetical protein
MNKKQFHSPQQSLFEETANVPEAVQLTDNEADPSFDLLDALNGPVIVFSEEWADNLPERFLKILPMARLAAILKHEPLATYTECVLYIYTRIMLGPMDLLWTNIYTHISCQTLSDCFEQDRWEAVDAHRILSDWEQSNLLDLRRRIYKTRREVLKQRLKQEGKTQKLALQHSNPEQPAGLEKPAKKEKPIEKAPSDQQSLF